jgi:hypothetical protein
MFFSCYILYIGFKRKRYSVRVWLFFLSLVLLRKSLTILRYIKYKYISIYIKKKVCLFVLYELELCRSECSGEDRGLLFDPKFWPPGYLVTPFLERYGKCPIQIVRACDCFLNNLRTKGDKDRRFSPFDTRDSEGIKVFSNLCGLFADESDSSVLEWPVILFSSRSSIQDR